MTNEKPFLHNFNDKTQVSIGSLCNDIHNDS